MSGKLSEVDDELWAGCDCTREEAGGLALFSRRYARQKLLSDPSLFVLDGFELQGMAINLWFMHYMPASHALAAYHCLSAYRMGLREHGGYFNQLRDQVAGDGAHVVTRFSEQLDQLRLDIEEQRLEVVNRAYDAANSMVLMMRFIPYIKGRPCLAVTTADQDPAHVEAAGPPPWRCRHSTPQMRELSELSAMFRTPAEGGTYIPGDLATMPKIFEAALEREIPKDRARQYQIILCGLQVGGRPKNPDKPVARKRRRRA